MKWLALVAQVVEKIPFERLLVRRPDNKERLQELADILGEAHSKPVGKGLSSRQNSPQKPPRRLTRLTWAIEDRRYILNPTGRNFHRFHQRDSRLPEPRDRQNPSHHAAPLCPEVPD